MLANMKLNMLFLSLLTAVFDCKMQAGSMVYYSYPAKYTIDNNTVVLNTVLRQSQCVHGIFIPHFATVILSLFSIDIFKKMKRHSLKSEHENNESKLGGSLPWNDCGVGIPIGNAATMLTLKG